VLPCPRPSAFVLGGDALQNRGAHFVTLESVELEHADDLVLTEARVTPVHRPGAVGSSA
jgi:hypothetical protein